MDNTTNFSGNVIAISALIAAGLTKLLGLNVEAATISQVIFGLIALVGMVKQMVDHFKQGTQLSTARKALSSRPNQ